LRVAQRLAWRDESVRLRAYILVTAAQMLDLGRKNHFDCYRLRIAEEVIVNKSQLVGSVNASTSHSRRVVEEVVDVLFDTIIAEVRSGRKVSVIGFGTFNPARRAARIGRNPRTGAVVPIPASKGVRFATGSTFKSALNPKEGAPMAVKKATRKKAAAKKAPARKTAARKSTAKKAPARKTAARKVAAKKTTAKKAVKKAVRKASAKKTTAKRAVKKAVRKTTAKRAPARKTAAKKATKRAPARKTAAKKATKRAPARKTAAKKATKRAPVRKTAAKRAPARKTVAKRVTKRAPARRAVKRR
jgi:DNA-binding protein HU-beta